MAAEPPQVYDVSTDQFRPATRADIDLLEVTHKAYFRLRQAVDTIHAELVAEIKVIRSKAGLPHN